MQLHSRRAKADRGSQWTKLELEGLAQTRTATSDIELTATSIMPNKLHGMGISLAINCNSISNVCLSTKVAQFFCTADGTYLTHQHHRLFISALLLRDTHAGVMAGRVQNLKLASPVQSPDK